MKKKTIDAIDIEILNILAGQAQVHNKELANKIGLSEGPTLVRVQKLWERGAIKSHRAIINFRLFGYVKAYLVQIEISDIEADELKQRFSLSRFIIVLVELEGSFDIVMRVYLGVFLVKNLKDAKDELKLLTSGLKGIRSTFNEISSLEQKTVRLDEKDVIR